MSQKDYLVETNDKVAGQEINYETRRNEFFIILKTDFAPYKLATVIGCDLFSGHGTLLGRFLTHDSHVQRLFLTIWEFCRD